VNLPDETVMAYVDDELDAASRAEVEAALAADPEVRTQVQAQIDLRARLRATFDPVLSEPVPERLLQAVRQSHAPSGGVADLASARELKRAGPQARRSFALPQFAAIAASLFLGVLIGQRILQSPGENAFVSREGRLIASGPLDEALTRQLASNQSTAAPVRIGLTYRNDSGDFCRTFAMSQDATLAGIACRSANAWRVEMLTQSETADAGTYRTAGGELPESIRRAVEASIRGEPLDADAERVAQGKGWR
jgi:hypothetical protein